MTSDGRPFPRETFAARLRAARLSRGFRTAKSFAEHLGIEQNTYTRYERGEVEPNIAVLERIWAALNLMPNELFGEAIDTLQSREPRTRPTTRVEVDPREALAWNLASAVIRSRNSEDGEASGQDAWQRIAALYGDLVEHPFETLRRLANDPAASAAPTVQREAAAKAMDMFSKALGQAPISRRSRPARPRPKL
jgi:transcriptional regulator with XRE-family HTH domain